MASAAATAADVSEVLCVRKLSPDAKLPVRASLGSAGYDLSSACSTVVKARGRQMVPTDLAITVPRGTYGRIAPRSGLALKNAIDVGAGVIDADYTGPVGIVLFNHADEDFKIAKGDRVAQLILERIAIVDVIEVGSMVAVSPAVVPQVGTRGPLGFGSTGTQPLVFS